MNVIKQKQLKLRNVLYNPNNLSLCGGNKVGVTLLELPCVPSLGLTPEFVGEPPPIANTTVAASATTASFSSWGCLTQVDLVIRPGLLEQ